MAAQSPFVNTSTEIRIRLAVWVSGLVLFLLLPLAWWPALEDPSTQPKHTIAALGALLVIVLLPFNKIKKSVRLPLAPVLLLSLFAGWGFLSLVNAQSVSEGVFEASKQIVTLGWLVAGLYLFSLGKEVIQTLLVFAWAGALLCVILGLAQTAGLELPAVMTRSPQIPLGMMGNKNLFGEMLFMLFPFVLLSLWYFPRNRNWRTVFLLTGIMALSFATRSRSVVLAVLVAGIVLLWMLPQVYRAAKNYYPPMLGRKWMAAYLGMALGVLCLLPVVRPGVYGDLLVDSKILFAREIPLIHSGSSSVEERAILWRHTLRLAAENPLVGCGVGNWRFRVPEYGVRGFYQGFGTRFYLQPHNEFLSVMCETGAVGLGLYLLLFIFSFVMAARRLRRREGDHTDRVMATVMAGGIAGFATMALTGFPREVAVTQCLFAMLLAAGWSGASSGKISIKTNFIVKVPLLLLLLGVTLLMGWRLNGERKLAAIPPMQITKEWAEMEKIAVAAENHWQPFMPLTSTPVAYYAGVACFHQQHFAAAIQHLERAKALYPCHPQVLQSLGSAYGMAGDLVKSEAAYRETLHFFPDFEEPLVNLCLVLMSQNKNEAARDALNKWYRGYKSERIEKIKNQLKTAGISFPGPGQL